MNIKTEAQRRALEDARLRERKTFLSFTRRAVLKQRARRKAVLGENPYPSKAWKQPEIIDAFEGLPQAVLDQCEYGLKHPENHMPIQKATRFMGQEEVLTYLHTRCSGDHDHAVIEGNVRVGGRTVKLSEWCGGYSLPLCEAILHGAELYLQSDSRHETYFHNEVMAEELMMDGEEVQEQAEEEEEETEENKEFQEPRMLPEDKQERDIEDLLDAELEDPETAAQQHAERHAEKNPPPAAPDHRLWRCNVCATRAPPKHPTAAAPGLRPYGFNRHHLVDFKYFRDSRRKLYVALSMLDAGTLFHQAVLLKTRRSEYCADKWHKHWLCIFGAPAKIRLDQGGEFEGGFTALLENYSIPSTVTATQAGWQHSLAERHGGLLGIIMEAIVLEHQVEGFSHMKQALAAAIAAKNQTVSRDGYTPNQKLYGQEVRFPGLTDEEERLGFAESIGTEGQRRYASGLWRGPATVLVREGQTRYFVSWRGRCLLLAEENMRLATGEELALQSPMPEQDLKDLARILKDPEGNKGFEDDSNAAAPPKPPPPRMSASRQLLRAQGQAMMRGLRSAKRLLRVLPPARQNPTKRRKMIADGQRPVALPPPPEAPRERLQLPGVAPRALAPPVPDQRDDVSVSPVPTTPLDDTQAEPPQVLDEELQNIDVHRRRLLDDVPISIKRKEIPREDPSTDHVHKKLRVAYVFALASMFHRQDAPQNEWLSKYWAVLWYVLLCFWFFGLF
eukprot:s2435_g4.t1